MSPKNKAYNLWIDHIIKMIESGELEGYSLTVNSEDRPILTFTSPINSETSFSTTQLANTAQSTMEVFSDSIEWIVEELDMVEHIGYFCTQDYETVDSYDGVFTMPVQAIILLKYAGFKIDVEELCMEHELEDFYKDNNIKDRDFDSLLDSLERLHP